MPTHESKKWNEDLPNSIRDGDGRFFDPPSHQLRESLRLEASSIFDPDEWNASAAQDALNFLIAFDSFRPAVCLIVHLNDEHGPTVLYVARDKINRLLIDVTKCVKATLRI